MRLDDVDAHDAFLHLADRAAKLVVFLVVARVLWADADHPFEHAALHHSVSPLAKLVEGHVAAEERVVHNRISLEVAHESPPLAVLLAVDPPVPLLHKVGLAPGAGDFENLADGCSHASRGLHGQRRVLCCDLREHLPALLLVLLLVDDAGKLQVLGPRLDGARLGREETEAFVYNLHLNLGLFFILALVLLRRRALLAVLGSCGQRRLDFLSCFDRLAENVVLAGRDIVTPVPRQLGRKVDGRNGDELLPRAALVVHANLEHGAVQGIVGDVREDDESLEEIGIVGRRQPAGVALHLVPIRVRHEIELDEWLTHIGIAHLGQVPQAHDVDVQVAAAQRRRDFSGRSQALLQ